jgi:hypothetical protein
MQLKSKQGGDRKPNYQIFKITGNTLHFGDHEVMSEGDRPTRLDMTNVLKR